MEALGNNATSVEALLQALESGELERLLERPVRARDAAPRQARRLRADEIAELVNAYRQGSSVSSVARRFGISRGTASSHLATAGVTKRTEILAAERARIIQLLEAGHSANKIGVMVGRDPKTVRAVIESRKAAIPPAGLAVGSPELPMLQVTLS